MNTYQIHVDTASLQSATSSQALVSKTNSNPFQCSVLFGNRHRGFKTASLLNAQIPIGFYNVRSPYNSITIASNTYTVNPGSYTTPASFLTAVSNVTAPLNGTWSYLSNTNQINFSSGSSMTITVPTGLTYPSLAQLLGFTSTQTGTSITAQNSYIINFDTYINIFIENIGTSSLEPSQITYKVPVNGAVGNVIYWNENSQFTQKINVTDDRSRVDRLNITVLDRFGNILNNNGLDWSFSIEVESEN